MDKINKTTSGRIRINNNSIDKIKNNVELEEKNSCSNEKNQKENGKVERLFKKGEMVFYKKNDGESVSVRFVKPRPLNIAAKEVSILEREKNKEILYIENIDDIDENIRDMIKEEIKKNTIMPIIKKVIKIEAQYGNYYWKVDTDKGIVSFVLTSPAVNVSRLTEKQIFIKDVNANCYLIENIEDLDYLSKIEIDKYI